MRIFGWFVSILMILGAFNIIDFHVCIAGSGKCDSECKDPEKTKEKKK